MSQPPLPSTCGARSCCWASLPPKCSSARTLLPPTLGYLFRSCPCSFEEALAWQMKAASFAKPRPPSAPLIWSKCLPWSLVACQPCRVVPARLAWPGVSTIARKKRVQGEWGGLDVKLKQVNGYSQLVCSQRIKNGVRQVHLNIH